ncbi:MAG: histidine kinase, partial [Opitutaceae bacterium]|nr:histidine kinase [Opitutaceae bacterium]
MTPALGAAACGGVFRFATDDMRRSLTLLLILFAAAFILVLAFAAQLVFAARLTYPQALSISLGNWQVPFLIAAVAALVSTLCPLRPPRLARNILLHLAALLALLAAAGHLEHRRLPVIPRLRPEPPAREFRFHYQVENIENRRRETATFQIPLRPPERPWPFWTILASSRWQLHLAAFLTAAALAHAWQLHLRAGDRERHALELAARLTSAKLHSLRLQLQPHFLFNTLNAISTLVHSAPETADEMIVNLSHLLRATLDTTVHEHPLREELATLDIYLQIEQARLADRLRIVRDIAPETLSAQVPALLLQPIAENAVRHAIEPLPHGGTLTLAASTDGRV